MTNETTFAIELADILERSGNDVCGLAAKELRRLTQENWAFECTNKVLMFCWRRCDSFEEIEDKLDEFDSEMALNARIMKAAPDLLAALRDLVDAMTGRMDGETVALHNALAVIARCTNKQSTED